MISTHNSEEEVKCTSLLHVIGLMRLKFSIRFVGSKNTLVNVYVDLVVFTRIAGTS